MGNSYALKNYQKHTQYQYSFSLGKGIFITMSLSPVYLSLCPIFLSFKHFITFGSCMCMYVRVCTTARGNLLK